jgi:hypothetical protein
MVHQSFTNCSPARGRLIFLGVEIEITEAVER